MERKEHPVPVISASGYVLEVLDTEGNPYKPDGPVKYQIIGEDGSTLKEGTLEDTNLIPLEGVTTKSFRVVLENHFVLDVEGFEPPEEEATEEPIGRTTGVTPSYTSNPTNQPRSNSQTSQTGSSAA